MIIEVIKAVDDFLEKAGSRKRSSLNYRRLLNSGERKMISPSREFMEFMIDEILKGLSKMKKGTPQKMVNSITDWDDLREQGVKIFKPVLLELLDKGGDSVVRRGIKKQERFDPIGVEAVKWVSKHGAEMVREITDKSMDAMREFFRDGINRGWSTQEMARAIRPYVGLTEKQLVGLANYEEKLIETRPDLTANRIRSMTNTKAKRMVNDRVMLISRTESSSALNEGIREGYLQMGIKRLERVEDPRCCDICAEYNGKIYTVDEAQGVLPEHPGCEGVWVMA